MHTDVEVYGSVGLRRRTARVVLVVDDRPVVAQEFVALLELGAHNSDALVAGLQDDVVVGVVVVVVVEVEVEVEDGVGIGVEVGAAVLT